MKYESEPSSGKVIVFVETTNKFYLYFKTLPARRHSCVLLKFRSVRKFTSMSAADRAKLSEFQLQIGEAVNEDIGEGVLDGPRDEDADSDSDEDDETEPFRNYNLHPSVDDHNSRDLELMVHNAAPDSDNIPPEADVADDNRRSRNVNALIDAVYPGINTDKSPNEYFDERAILAPTNASVGRINETYVSPPKQKSIFRPTKGVAHRNLFKQEFLNSLNFSSIPPHKIVLKVGTLIIKIRNLNSVAGLCNGTRLRVVSLRARSIEATVMSGPAERNTVFISRIIFYTEDDDKEFPFNLKRKLFPVVPVFAMTINRTQVTSQKAIKLAVGSEMIDVDGTVHAKNVVYREFFDHVIA
ncbi:LOW QUALITY PROTEIN: Helitron helicase [Phytophthora megakarya]|uniref:Helitron helicase n=1 Tax=Phytophthora megakarya TaxID=4795 RepID=A0A225VED7_9STRA|nr:LOW QUALITY PROTEIN: Helitron helicase [Phytophthora megakarya]